MKLILLIILIIFLAPTYLIGGIPIRLEDILYLFILIIYPTLKLENTKNFITILILIVIAYFITFSFQIFSGYAPVIQDMNSIFSLIRNIIIFCAALKLGQSLKGNQNSIYLSLSIGFFISSIISIIQFYNIAGLGSVFYLFFGKESGMLYGINRAIGTMGNPNYAAFFQICGIIGLLSLKNPSKFLKTTIIPFFLIISTWAVYLTFSRTGLIALIMVFIGYLILKKKRGIILFISIILFFTLPFLGSILENTRYSDRASDMLTLNGRVDSIWDKKLEAFYDNPVWGISSSDGANSDTVFDIAIFDNSYLYLLVVSGLVGLILNLTFNIKVLIFFKNIRIKNLYIYIALLHINIFIFYMTTDLVKGVMFTSFYFLVTGLLLSINKNQFINKNDTTNIHPNLKLE